MKIVNQTFTAAFKSDRIEMQVPVHPPRGGSAVVIMSGRGVLSKVGIGSPELSLQDWLRIENRGKAGRPYTKAERVAIGMIALNDSPIQGSDQVRSTGGATFRMGTNDQRIEPGSMHNATDQHLDFDLATWLVTHPDGRPRLLVIPREVNGEIYHSFNVADYVAELTDGEVCIELINSGVYTAADDLIAPGWNLYMDRRDVLDLTQTTPLAPGF